MPAVQHVLEVVVRAVHLRSPGKKGKKCGFRARNYMPCYSAYKLSTVDSL